MGYVPKADTRPNLAFGILETRRKRHPAGTPADVLSAVERAKVARAERLGHRRAPLAPVADKNKGRSKKPDAEV